TLKRQYLKEYEKLKEDFVKMEIIKVVHFLNYRIPFDALTCGIKSRSAALSYIMDWNVRVRGIHNLWLQYSKFTDIPPVERLFVNYK
ncbi:MAG: hypothetical protein LIO65_08930, partial [Odoribacter sp.]|nr:hypothetical protein [Odoribacter sp.]